jgi:HEPN domain-containing protein
MIRSAEVTNRAPDWLRQAEADLEHARASLDHGDHEWACFAAQQSAEKAVKAVFFHLHGDPWGHSLLALLEGLVEPARKAVTAELLDAARALDKQYIPTRYPNGFAQGAPTDYYTARDARESIGHAESILSFCRAALRQPVRDAQPGAGDGGPNHGETP